MDVYKGGSSCALLGHPVNDFHQKRCCNLLKDHGGLVVIGNADAHKDFNLTPTVILNPSLESKLMKEETFGPILPVITVKDIQEAI